MTPIPSFTLNANEQAAVRRFQRQFKGGSFTFTFTPTGIGTAVEVRHSSGVRCDVTDYGSW